MVDEVPAGCLRSTVTYTADKNSGPLDTAPLLLYNEVAEMPAGFEENQIKLPSSGIYSGAFVIYAFRNRSSAQDL